MISKQSHLTRLLARKLEVKDLQMTCLLLEYHHLLLRDLLLPLHSEPRGSQGHKSLLLVLLLHSQLKGAQELLLLLLWLQRMELNATFCNVCMFGHVWFIDMSFRLDGFCWTCLVHRHVI